jgi:hypothetical protein
LEVPYSRSTNTMGTSAMTAPAACTPSQGEGRGGRGGGAWGIRFRIDYMGGHCAGLQHSGCACNTCMACVPSIVVCNRRWAASATVQQEFPRHKAAELH